MFRRVGCGGDVQLVIAGSEIEEQIIEIRNAGPTHHRVPIAAGQRRQRIAIVVACVTSYGASAQLADQSTPTDAKVIKVPPEQEIKQSGASS